MQAFAALFARARFMIPTTGAAAFRRDTLGALQNSTQRASLAQAMARIGDRRKERMAELVDVEGLTHLGAEIKTRALRDLPQLLEQLEDRLQERGVQVHWAETAAQANEAVLRIARQNAVQLVVKGKSMLSEELGLNEFLAQHGIQALEADFGEFIMQLAAQPPSHIVAPAVHLRRKEISRLLTRELGVEPTEDVRLLTDLVRGVLREKFREAGMGLSGVNFAVAETGTLALVENEGNGRMVTSVPPVHVAMMGLEKVIPRLADLAPLMRLLTRSATGQKVTSYLNWISAPKAPGELDGPREVHLILVDNGRSAIRAHSTLRSTLHCIRCGACLNSCPIYKRIGGHAYGSPYMGPIGKLLTPQMAGLGHAAHLAGASTLCGACAEVCPVRIPIPDLLLQLRREAVQPSAAGKMFLRGAGTAAWHGEAMLWKGWQVLNSRAASYRVFARLLGRIGGRLPRLGPLKAWSRVRELPQPARETLHDLMRDRPSA